MPLSEVPLRHIGLVAHDRFFKQLLFGMLSAGGNLAPLYNVSMIGVVLARASSCVVQVASCSSNGGTYTGKYYLHKQAGV